MQCLHYFYINIAITFTHRIFINAYKVNYVLISVTWTCSQTAIQEYEWSFIGQHCNFYLEPLWFNNCQTG